MSCMEARATVPCAPLATKSRPLGWAVSVPLALGFTPSSPSTSVALTPGAPAVCAYKLVQNKQASNRAAPRVPKVARRYRSGEIQQRGFPRTGGIIALQNKNLFFRVTSPELYGSVSYDYY